MSEDTSDYQIEIDNLRNELDVLESYIENYKEEIGYLEDENNRLRNIVDDLEHQSTENDYDDYKQNLKIKLDKYLISLGLSVTPVTFNNRELEDLYKLIRWG